MDPLYIRPARLDEVDELYDVYVRAIESLAAPHHPRTVVNAWMRALSAEDFARQMRRGARFLVAESLGQIAGFGALRDRRMWLLFVHPLASRGGVGRVLVAALEEDARLAGVVRLELHASLNSVPFYRACGYEEGGEVEQILSGVLTRAVRMGKTL